MPLRVRRPPPGESPGPVSEYDDVEYDDSLDVNVDLLDWREMIENTHLRGPVRLLATSSEVESLTMDGVRLRVAFSSLWTPETQHELARAMSQYLGRPFAVEGGLGVVNEAHTIEGQDEEAHRQRIARAMADLQADPGIHALSETLGATIDAASLVLKDE